MRATAVTATDVALLRSLATQRSIVAACRRLGISRDRANYRIARLARAFGGPVVASARGGREHGGTRLTPLGDRIARGGYDAVEMLGARPLARLPLPNRIPGVYRVGPPSRVDADDGTAWQVSFPASDGERVALLLDPEAILLARGHFRSSARNVRAAQVVAIRSRDGGRVAVLRTGGITVRAAVTNEALRQLALRPGARVWIYVKATALRRGAPPRR